MRINQKTFTKTSWDQEGYNSIDQNFCSFTFLYTNAKVVTVFTSWFSNTDIETRFYNLIVEAFG